MNVPKTSVKRILALMLTVALVAGLMMPAAPQAAAAQPDLRDALQPVTSAGTVDPDEIVTVIVELEGPTTLDSYADAYRNNSVGFSTSSRAATYRATLTSDQESVQSQIAALNPDAQFRYHYTNLLNGFAAKVRYGDIDAIRALDGVLNVYATQTYKYDNGWESDDGEITYISLEDYYAANGNESLKLNAGQYTDTSLFSDRGSVDQMGLQAAWNAGYNGAGKVVAVFDSSLRTSHKLFSYMDPEVKAAGERGELVNYKTQEGLKEIITNNQGSLNLFDSGWGSWFHQRPNDETGFDQQTQANILNGGFWYSDKVPFAVDYMDGDLEVWDGDASSHGTHVSGIVAGNPGPIDKTQPVSMENANGVLGGAYNAQIMFFKIFSEYDEFGQESDEAVFAALDDAVTLGANAFNLSLGIPNGFSTMNTYAQAGYQRAYNRAKRAGISIAVSAGNDARDPHSGAAVSGYTTVLPNSYMLGFSGSLLGPMTVASAQGTGYAYAVYVNRTTATITSLEDDAVYTAIKMDDNNVTPMGKNEALANGLQMVYCGYGTAADFEQLGEVVQGKVALIQRGDITFVEKQENAYKAGAAAVLMVNNADEDLVLSGAQIWDTTKMPVFGMPANSKIADIYYLGDTPAVTPLTTSFTSVYEKNPIEVSYNDVGPSGFTSWGVTESLKLKPDIMAPGGSILSAGAASDEALSVKSGTSMASPNMQGAFVVIQQAVDSKIKSGIFPVEPNTQGYSDLVDQLAASTAKVYAPLTGNAAVYFSPRRQGAGMVQVGDAINSNVLLHNNVAYDAQSGEAPRAKIELGDRLGGTFEISYIVENFNSSERIYNLLACLQTDKAMFNENTGRYNLVPPQSDGSDIEALTGAVIRLKSVSGNATITAGADNNLNRYATDAQPASISIPANANGGNAITVTLEVTLPDMTQYDNMFPNGMFLEGFVWMENTNGTESVNIPFMGFRGDFTKAPIFDLADAYTDVSGKATSDLDYPLFSATAMMSRFGEDAAFETPLGVNQYMLAWPGYQLNGMADVRAYFNTQRNEEAASSSLIAFSPDNDGYGDIAYAALTLLRNAKAVCVEILDQNGNVIRTIGPEFEYFEALNTDGNEVQQVAMTYGTKYNRNMAWDGTNDARQYVADGQYTYKIYAMTELEFMRSGLTPITTWDKDNHIMTGMDAEYMNKVVTALKSSPTAQSISMPVKVDTAKPRLTVSNLDASNNLTVVATDTTGLQAIAVYYDGELASEVLVLAGDKRFESKLDLSDFISATSQFDKTKLNIQVVDYAMNLTSAGVNSSAGPDDSDGGSSGGSSGSSGGSYTPIPTPTPSTNPGSADKYTDIESHWAKDAIAYVVEKGLFTGTGESTFSPDVTLDRAMFATVLWRMAGKTAPAGSKTFSDVESGSWYADAVAWAAEAGVVTGTSETTFAPTTSITREQLAVMLYRYLVSKDADSATISGDLAAFNDAASVSDWAAEAMRWAVSNGYLTGKPGSLLDPQGLATRAEAAVILQRFLETK